VYTIIQPFAIALQGNASSSTHRQLKPSYLHDTQNAHTHVQANTHLSYVIQTQTLSCTAYLSPIAAPICCLSIAACSRRTAPSPRTKHHMHSTCTEARTHTDAHTRTQTQQVAGTVAGANDGSSADTPSLATGVWVCVCVCVCVCKSVIV
jgi:hypothetical protein